jgi:hypothetical protein
VYDLFSTYQWALPGQIKQPKPGLGLRVLFFPYPTLFKYKLANQYIILSILAASIPSDCVAADIVESMHVDDIILSTI